MSPRWKTALTFGGSLVLGGGLLWLALRGVDFSTVGDAFRTANYAWLAPLVVVTFVAHGLRAWRWRLLLDVLPEEPGADPSARGAKPRASTLQAFYATMVGYMVNQAMPRLGEPARAANLAGVTRHGFAAVFGTVVVERLLDVVTLGIALLSVLVLFRDQLGRLLAEFGAGARALSEGLRAQSGLLIALGVVALAVGIGAVWWMRRRASARTGKLSALLAGFGAGLRSLLHVRARFGVFASTVLMWFAYAVMTYIPLQMLGLVDAYDLTLLDAWAMVSLGAVGMALPAPGGTGSYHYAIIMTMTLLLGVPETPAATYALLTHAVQLVFMVVVGFGCLLTQGAGLGSLRSATTPERDASAAPPLAQPASAE